MLAVVVVVAVAVIAVIIVIAVTVIIAAMVIIVAMVIVVAAIVVIAVVASVAHGVARVLGDWIRVLDDFSLFLSFISPCTWFVHVGNSSDDSFCRQWHFDMLRSSRGCCDGAFRRRKGMRERKKETRRKWNQERENLKEKKNVSHRLFLANLCLQAAVPCCVTYKSPRSRAVT